MVGGLIEDDSAAQEHEADAAELTDSQKLYLDIWTTMIQKLSLDDASQPIGKPTKTQNYFLAMPPSGGRLGYRPTLLVANTVWVSISGLRGVILEILPISNYWRMREAINLELDIPVEWQSVGGQRQ